MRDRLAAEGLFNEDLKRALPLLPSRVGVVTSPTGAAIRDILNILARRTRTVHVLFAPTRVQGEGASAEIVRAIELLNEHHALALLEGREDEAIDVIIVGRGGGSAEDLWAFNDERVARALRASVIPVISAVGHETDFTIADFAADVRAPTPSAAAELVAAREDEIAATVQSLSSDLLRAMRFQLVDARMRVQDAAMSRGFDDARASLHQARLRADDAAHKLETVAARATQDARRRADALDKRLHPARLSARVAGARARYGVLETARNAVMAARLDEETARLAVAVASLDALSPLAVLKRGYALAQDERGVLLRDARQAKEGDALRVRLSEGVLHCRVEKAEN
jgi:exodeoxyribonuclease VII large subunit